VAEAGLEWTVARLNESQTMASAGSCTTTSTSSFGDLYLPMVPKVGFTIVSTLWSGCSMAANGATTCSCPTAASTNPSFGTAANPTKTARSTVGVVQLVNADFLIELEAFAVYPK